VHANSGRETFLRLRNLLASAGPGIPLSVHDEMVKSNINLVLHVRKLRVGDEVRRRVVEVVETESGEVRDALRYDPECDAWA